VNRVVPLLAKLAVPVLVVDDETFVPLTFVKPHLCAGCHRTTDVSPCHRCGHRAAIAEAHERA
jgi:hypothetical protein